jgi:hypothetical protein
MCHRGIWSLAILAVAQAAFPQRSAVLEQPYGPDRRLVSPNGAYALFGSGQPPQLWLEDLRVRQRRLVLEATLQTLTLAWSPDSAAFVANDRMASDVEEGFIYDVRTLERVILRDRIEAADVGAARFMRGGSNRPHSYVHGIRWIDEQKVEAQLFGHTDGVRNGTTVISGDCFDLRYSVSRKGEVEKLSERVLPISSKQCENIERRAD